MKLFVDGIIAGAEQFIYGADIETGERYGFDCAGIDMKPYRLYEVVSVKSGAPSSAHNGFINLTSIEKTNLSSFNVRVTECPLMIRGRDPLDAMYALRGELYEPEHIDHGKEVLLSVTKRALLDISKPVEDTVFTRDSEEQNNRTFHMDRLVPCDKGDVMTFYGCRITDSTSTTMTIEAIGGCRGIGFACSATILDARWDKGGGFTEVGACIGRPLVDIECKDGPYGGQRITLVSYPAKDFFEKGSREIVLRDAVKYPGGIAAGTVSAPNMGLG